MLQALLASQVGSQSHSAKVWVLEVDGLKPLLWERLASWSEPFPSWQEAVECRYRSAALQQGSWAQALEQVLVAALAAMVVVLSRT